MSHDWSIALYGALLDASLRTALLAGFVALILRSAHIRSNRVRHAAWTTVLAAALLMPILPHLLPSLPVPVPVSLRAMPSRGKVEAPAPSAANGNKAIALSSLAVRGSPAASASVRRPLWTFAPAVLYLAGVLFGLSRALVGWGAISRVVRECSPIRRDALRAERKLPAPVCESPMVAAPLTAGIFAPRIILPAAWRRWAPEKLKAVLAHESAHVRRRDTLTACLSRLNTCIFWFNPLAWWLERRIAADAELACDEDAVRATGEKALYAEVLLDMAQAVRRRGGRLAWHGVGVEGNGLFTQRIEHILRGVPDSEVSRPRRISILFGCAAAIVLTAACRMPEPAAPREPALPAASGSIFAKRVRILTHPVNAPMEFGSGTSVQGLDVDIGNQIGNSLGKKVKWVKAPTPGYIDNRLQLVVDKLFGRSPASASLSTYEFMLMWLHEGKAEILLSAIAIDPVLAMNFQFSRPYYETGDIIACRRDRDDISDLASLSGKTVGVAAGRPGDTFMAGQKTAARVTLARYATIDDALGALNRREIDAVVGDEPLVTYSCITSFPNTAPLPGLIHSYQYAAVVRTGETELLARINATIDRMESTGELRKLNQSWFKPVLKNVLAGSDGSRGRNL